MVRNIFFLILIIGLLSCNGDDDKKGDINLRFHLLYDGQPMEMFKEYPYPGTNEAFYLSRLSFYMSDVSISNGSTDKNIFDLDYLNLTAAFPGNIPTNGYPFRIADAPVGEYTHLTFNIGIPKASNAKSPAQYPAGHILSFPAEYWDSWKSYVFFKTEGSIKFKDNAPDETDFALHLGGDEALRKISLNKVFTVKDGKTTDIDITLDVKKYFNALSTYDIHDTQKIHSLSQMPLIHQLMDNLAKAFE